MTIIPYAGHMRLISNKIMVKMGTGSLGCMIQVSKVGPNQFVVASCTEMSSIIHTRIAPKDKIVLCHSEDLLSTLCITGKFFAYILHSGGALDSHA